MQIRPEKSTDAAAARTVNLCAFEQSAEADLVDTLRQNVEPLISLVAEEDGGVVGHIVFSPVSLPESPDAKVAGLGPMSVLPSYQLQGIGSALVQAGLEACSSAGFVAVVVLGHPEFYPRFGFVPASQFSIESEYDVPDKAFMALELLAGALDSTCGQAKYDAAFGAV